MNDSINNRNLDVNDHSIKQASSFGPSTGGDRDWMNFSSANANRGSAMERPATANNNSNAKVSHLEN
jgi:hypothetical protein